MTFIPQTRCAVPAGSTPGLLERDLRGFCHVMKPRGSACCLGRPRTPVATFSIESLALGEGLSCSKRNKKQLNYCPWPGCCLGFSRLECSLEDFHCGGGADRVCLCPQGSLPSGVPSPSRGLGSFLCFCLFVFIFTFIRRNIFLSHIESCEHCLSLLTSVSVLSVEDGLLFSSPQSSLFSSVSKYQVYTAST